MVSEEDLEKDDPFAINAIKTPGGTSVAFNPNHKAFVESKWCYDTPGTVSPQQVRNRSLHNSLMHYDS